MTVAQFRVDQRRGCSPRPMPSIPLTIVEPSRLIGMSDSFFADLKPSRIGSHANHIRPARSKNMIPNGLRKWPAPRILAQKASTPSRVAIVVMNIRAIIAFLPHLRDFDLLQAPHVVRLPRLHRRGHPQRLVDAAASQI